MSRLRDRCIHTSSILTAVATTLGSAASVLAQPAGASPWGRDIRMTRTPTPSETSINFARNVAADEFGGVHTVWFDQRFGLGEIFYKRSPDAGESWGPSIRLTEDSGDSVYPTVAVHGDLVVVVWFDMRPDDGPQLYLRRSTNGGAEFSPAQRLTVIAGAHPSVAIWDNNVHITYVSPELGDGETFYLRSTDAGATWDPPRVISDLSFNSYTPTISVFGPHVYIAWTDTRHGGAFDMLEEEYISVSHDNGATFGPNQRLTFDPPESPANSWAPSLESWGQFVWITWFDQRDGDWEIYFKRSADFGETWSDDERLTFANGDSARPSIARRGSTLSIVWYESRDGNTEIYLKESHDFGTNWGPDQRLTFASGDSSFATAAASKHGLFVTWTDERNGAKDVYFKARANSPVKLANGRIAFTRLVDGEPQIFTMHPDGTGDRQLTFGPGANQYPAWSKDGTTIAFASLWSGSSQIWLMDADGSNPRQLTSDPAQQNFVPDWSHDGTRITYASADQSVGHPEVWIMDWDGSDAERLTVTPPNQTGPTWSLHPTFSQNDERIYYASTISGSTQIWGMFDTGQGAHQKTNGLGRDFPDANVPEFSRDGQDVVFWAGFETQYGEVWTMDESGANQRRVTSTLDPRNSDNPSWSPDGRFILFDTNRDNAVEIWITDRDGTNARPLISDGLGQTSWQPVFPRPVRVP